MYSRCYLPLPAFLIGILWLVVFAFPLVAFKNDLLFSFAFFFFSSNRACKSKAHSSFYSIVTSIKSNCIYYIMPFSASPIVHSFNHVFLWGAFCSIGIILQRNQTRKIIRLSVLRLLINFNLLSVGKEHSLRSLCSFLFSF